MNSFPYNVIIRTRSAKYHSTPLAAFLFSFILLFAVSCQKTDDNQPPPSTTYKLKTYIEAISGNQNSKDTFALTYDASDRLVSAISQTGFKFVYQYNGTTNYTADLMQGNHTQIHQVLYLNANLLPDSSFQYNDTNDSSTQKYTYNQAKQVLQFKEYAYSKKTGAVLQLQEDNTYDNGNLIKTVQRTANGNINYTVNYTYTTSKAQVFTPAGFYQPAQSFNLPATISTVYTNGPTVTWNATYTFDSLNRMTSQTRTLPGVTTVVYTYIYQ